MLFKSTSRPLRCTQMNCANLHRFLLNSGKTSDIKNIFDIFKTITYERNKKSREFNTFFHLLFKLKSFVTFIFAFENGQKSSSKSYYAISKQQSSKSYCKQQKLLYKKQKLLWPISLGKLLKEALKKSPPPRIVQF